MMPVSLHIHYCDSIIRHADDFRYSLIGIYPGVCPLPSRDFVLAQLNLCLTFEIPTNTKLKRTPLSERSSEKFRRPSNCLLTCSRQTFDKSLMTDFIKFDAAVCSSSASNFWLSVAAI